MTLSRRSFLKNSTAASAAAALSGGLVSAVIGKENAIMAAGPGNKWPGRVVINFNKGAASFSKTGAGTSVPAVIKTMVDDSIKRLTEKTDLGEAWKAIFPASLSATSTIAIKVPLGCANQTVAPHWSLVKAITDGLQFMDFGGTRFPAANITIYDMRCSDNLSGYGYTSANFPGVKLVYDSMGNGYTDGAKKQQYATSLNKANFLINVFRPGGHGNQYGGVTLGFKNHYGTYAVDHNNSTAPGYLRDINCTGAVYNKNVLSVCAGIFGAQEASGSPGSAAINYARYAATVEPDLYGPFLTFRAQGISFDGTVKPCKITRTSGNFQNEGYAAGMKIRVSGAASAGNNSLFTVQTVTATVLTLSATDSVTTEAAGASVSISQVFTLAATNISFNNVGTADTINRTSGSFVSDGITAGTVIKVSGAATTANNSVFTVKTVTATTITLSAWDSLTAEAAGASVTISPLYTPSTTIIMSTDPVTAEMECIKMMRLNNGGKYGAADMPSYLKASGGITGALADAVYNIGVVDESDPKFDLRRIIDGSGTTAVMGQQVSHKNLRASIAASQTGRYSTFIEFSLPASYIGKTASIEIRNLKGALITRITHYVSGAISHVLWNQTDISGNRVAKGSYIVSLISEGISVSSRFTILR